MTSSSSISTKQIQPSVVMSILPTLLVNMAFVLQAIIFDWQLSTLIWIYWLEGAVLLLIALLVQKKGSAVFLLLPMVIYGIFLLSMTIPSDSTTYLINGKQVTAEEFTILSNVQWNAVFINVGALVVGYGFTKFLKKESRYFDTSRVARRLTPLHLTIIFALTVAWPLYLFLALRTFFDISAEYTLAKLRPRS